MIDVYNTPLEKNIFRILQIILMIQFTNFMKYEKLFCLMMKNVFI